LALIGPSVRVNAETPSEAPKAIASGFLRSLDDRHWSGACELMLPGTRSFFAGHGSCPAKLRAAFRESFGRFSFSEHHWRSAILAGTPTVTPGENSVALRFEEVERYRCIQAPKKPPCRRHWATYRRPEWMYFAPDHAGELKIAKLGAIVSDMRLSGPDLAESELLAPASASSLRQPAQISEPAFSCSGQRLGTVSDEPGDVQNEDYESVSATPWLDATSISLVRSGPASVCVSLGLSAPPHPDSAYYLFWHRPEKTHGGFGWARPNGQTLADRGSVAGWAEANVEIEVDGEGRAAAEINNVGALTQPSLAAYLPRFGYTEGKLEIELTPRQGFTMSRSWSIFPDLNAEPTWGDTLLRHSFTGYDRVPDNECLLYPSGKLKSEFFCQAPSG
jgi:hypothetical protein